VGEENDEGLIVYDDIVVEYPDEIFITIVSTTSSSSNGAGNFLINYNFIDRIPEEVLPTMTEEQRRRYFDKQVIVTQEAVYSSVNFWVVVLSAFLAFVCLIGIIYLFCKMKEANVSIVADVEVLKP